MLTVGDKLPDIALPNQDDVHIHLSAYLGKKLVLFAFPMAGTRRCNKQACTYRDSYGEFSRYNATILGITGNPVGVLQRWHKHHRLPFNTLSDTEHILLDELGAWGDPLVGGIEIPLAKRSFWVIDEQGIIIEAQIEVDFEQSVYHSLDFIRQSA